MHLKAILFDFDGVLADTEKLHLRAFQEVLGEQGVRLSAEDYHARYLGLDDYHVLLAIARDCGLPPGDARVRSLLEQKARRYGQLIATERLLFDGVEGLVRDWSGQVPLAVASGALRREIEETLGRGGLLGCFGAIVSADDVSRGKPAPDTFLAALERLRASIRRTAEGGRHVRSAGVAPGLKPGSPTAESVVRPPGSGPVANDVEISAAGCVVIEDSLPGITAAKAAGMHVVGVATSHPAEGLREAELVVSSLTDLRLSMLDDLVRPA
jgi:beta-phosphoglucomutase-like phosphatase (HAD superfamily)